MLVLEYLEDKERYRKIHDNHLIHKPDYILMYFLSVLRLVCFSQNLSYCMHNLYAYIIVKICYIIKYFSKI